jgi:hypothetical protein
MFKTLSENRTCKFWYLIFTERTHFGLTKYYRTTWFPYDAVNRNKVSIRQLSLLFLLTHYMFRPLQAILRWDIQLDVSKDYTYYNGSVVRTQLDVCLWYFDPWSVIRCTYTTWRMSMVLRPVVRDPLYVHNLTYVYGTSTHGPWSVVVGIVHWNINCISHLKMARRGRNM